MVGVILAGGRGSRLMPLTRDIPKPMVPIVDKPVLWYIVQSMAKAGVRDIVVTLGYKGQVIMDAMGDGGRMGVRLRYSTENEPLGSAGGVKNAEHLIGGQDMLIVSGDAYTDIRLDELICAHYDKHAYITMATAYQHNASRYGVVLTDEEGKVVGFEEKPSMPKSHWVNTGIYVMDNKVLAALPHGPSDWARDVLCKMPKGLYARHCTGYWSDIGTLASYYMTNYHVVCAADSTATEPVTI